MSRFTEDDVLESGNLLAAAILLAGQSIAYQIKCLGLAEAITPMGALELLAMELKNGLSSIADGIESVASKDE